MRACCVCADEGGESHLEELDLPMTSMEFAPSCGRSAITFRVGQAAR